MDACFVGKGVCSHYGLVGLYGNTCNLTYKLACCQELVRVYTRVNVSIEIRPCAQGHHDLFHGSIACALTQAIDGHLYLPRSPFDGG